VKLIDSFKNYIIVLKIIYHVITCIKLELRKG